MPNPQSPIPNPQSPIPNAQSPIPNPQWLLTFSPGKGDALNKVAVKKGVNT